MSEKVKYPCPVCGNKYLDEEYGSFEICPICGWEEDGIQQLYPDETGINKAWTLNNAKKRGIMEKHCLIHILIRIQNNLQSHEAE